MAKSAPRGRIKAKKKCLIRKVRLPLTNKSAKPIFAILVKVIPVAKKDKSIVCHAFMRPFSRFIALPAMYRVMVRKKSEKMKWSGTNDVSRIEAKEKKKIVSKRASFFLNSCTSVKIR